MVIPTIRIGFVNLPPYLPFQVYQYKKSSNYRKSNTAITMERLKIILEQVQHSIHAMASAESSTLEMKPLLFIPFMAVIYRWAFCKLLNNDDVNYFIARSFLKSFKRIECFFFDSWNSFVFTETSPRHIWSENETEQRLCELGQSRVEESKTSAAQHRICGEARCKWGGSI